MVDNWEEARPKRGMADQPPSTPRPKVVLVPQHRPLTASGFDPMLADTEPILDELFASDEARNRDPLGAAGTLVWLAHTTLLEISQGASTSLEEWNATRTIVESAVRYLVLAQAQRIVDASVPYLRTTNFPSPLLEISRQLANLVKRANDPRAHEAERVWQLARQLELAAQCLFEWNAKGAIGVGSEEVFALAQELHFVYRDLQPFATRRS